MVAATKLGGDTWLKLTLLNPQATVEDILGVLEEVRTVGAGLANVAPEVA